MSLKENSKMGFDTIQSHCSSSKTIQSVCSWEQLSTGRYDKEFRQPGEHTCSGWVGFESPPSINKLTFTHWCLYIHIHCMGNI